jgi:glycerol uptake facilitator-like aquaporin
MPFIKTKNLPTPGAGPLMGASMNPARSLAPALLSGTRAEWWLYVVGPVAGALLAVVAERQRLLLNTKE